MRLKAITELTYAGKNWRPGQLFDAREAQARDFINKGLAEPFNLEDPSTRTLAGAIENLLPPAEPALPDVPAVSITPVGVIVPKAGSTGSIAVTITAPGASGTWTVDKDADATWLTYTPTTPQSADGTVTYTAEQNPGGQRTAHFYINGKTFTVDQNGLPVKG
jgi:hypothetical protein